MRVKAAPIAAMAVSIVLFFAALVGVAYFGGHSSCKAYGEQTGRKVKYHPQVGCLVETPNGWIPREELRQVYRVNP